MKKNQFSRRLALALLLLPSTALQAWDYDGHRIVNQLALASLPADYPAFVRAPAAAERIAFLAGEPDRWKNSPDLPLRHYNNVDHYLDLEELADAGMDVNKLPSLRYDFVVQFAAGRAAHPENFPKIDPAKNAEHSREWPGFAPWAITEYYGKLKSAFSYLKALEELGTPEEVANAQANIVYLMGVMGHYVGDCGQPLHSTVHHNGWVGDKTKGYTTWPGIHQWVDGGLIAKAGIKFDAIAPRVTQQKGIPLAPQADGRDPMFVAVMIYLQGSLEHVEPLYQLEQAGKLGDAFAKAQGKGKEPPKGPDTEPVSAEGQAFIKDQLLRSGEMLGAIWVTAWRNAPPDKFLTAQLLKRRAAAGK